MSSRSIVPESPSSVGHSEEKSSGTTPDAPDPLVPNLVPARRWPPDVDPRTGRIRSISAEEWQARQAELTRRLAEIDAQDDTPEEVYDEFMRNLDEERRRQGRPLAFEGF